MMAEQRASSVSKRGLPALVRPGLGKLGHIEAAGRLASPFQLGGRVDDDLVFAARAVAVFGPWAHIWREKQMKAAEKVVRAMQPLSDLIRTKLHPDVARVAADKEPAVMALFTTLLRWPDR